MRAAVVRQLPTDGLDLADVPEPAADRPDEVLVKVEACGICGTDLHILAGESYQPALPFVPGHEPIGTVIATGVDARAWAGRRVTTTLFESCGSCASCIAGDERLCPELRSILGVLGRWGAFAERFIVPAGQLVAVPDELPSVPAASLVDSGATAMNAAGVVVAHERRRIAIAGGGPVGLLVAELLAADGHALVVAEPNAARRAALAAGGHAVVERLVDAAGGLDCVVDCSGSPQAPASALDLLGPRGLLVLAGYSTVPQLDFAPVARKELTVRGVRSGSRDDLERVLRLASEQRIDLPNTRCWRLDDINEAFSALQRGAVDGKAVIQPDRGGARQEAGPQWTNS